MCESTAAEAANDSEMTERMNVAGKRNKNRRRRDDPHKGPHESGPPHRGLHKAANRCPQRDPHRKHTDKYGIQAASAASHPYIHRRAAPPEGRRRQNIYIYII